MVGRDVSVPNLTHCCDSDARGIGLGGHGDGAWWSRDSAGLQALHRSLMGCLGLAPEARGVYIQFAGARCTWQGWGRCNAIAKLLDLWFGKCASGSAGVLLGPGACLECRRVLPRGFLCCWRFIVSFRLPNTYNIALGSGPGHAFRGQHRIGTSIHAGFERREMLRVWTSRVGT